MTWREQDQNHLCFFHVWVCVYRNLTVCNPGVTVKEDFRSSCITKAQAPFRATLATPPGHPAFLPLLAGSTTASSTTLHSTLLWVLTADFFCVFHHQRGPVPPRAWDQAELQITPPVPRLALRIIIADCTPVCPAANTCLLTLISRNFMSPGDGCECANKMLQVL